MVISRLFFTRHSLAGYDELTDLDLQGLLIRRYLWNISVYSEHQLLRISQRSSIGKTMCFDRK